MIFDDHRAPRVTLEEIEAEADRCRSFASRDRDGRIDMFELLNALKIKLAVKPDAEMLDTEAYSAADMQQICCRRSVSRGLRFGDPHARYLIGHELGHTFLHRGSAPKARKLDGNRTLGFIHEDESAERQAWKFARALFVTRFDLLSGESDEEIAIRVGTPTGAVSLRRNEVRRAIQANRPKVAPPDVADYLDRLRHASREAEVAKSIQARIETEKREAWARAGMVPGENAAMARSARGFRVEWDHFGRADSQMGWTVHKGEVRSLMDMSSR